MPTARADLPRGDALVGVDEKVGSNRAIAQGAVVTCPNSD